MTERALVHVHLDVTPQATSGIDRLDVAVDQSPLADLRPSAPDRPPFAGLAWAEASSDTLSGEAGWLVERTIVWDHDPGGGDPADWIKQVSLVRRHVEIDEVTFAQRYARHRDVARAHHGMFRYAQSIVIAPVHGADDDRHRVDGISELWFRDRQDWRDRYYTSEAGPAAVRADVSTFIDVTTTSSAIVLEWPAMGEPIRPPEPKGE